MSNRIEQKKVGGGSLVVGIDNQSGAHPGKMTLTGAFPDITDTVGDRDDPTTRPPQYSAMDQAMVNLLFRSRREFFEGRSPFWDCVDKQLSVKHLQTLTQVISGARRLGLLSSIQILKDIHDYGNSWGINFKGPSVQAIATNGQWGKDWPQDMVRKEHFGTAHDWYRQDSGPGNPGMHLGVDVGAGYNNLHWDPTNPMERVSDGEISGSPLLSKMPELNDVIPKGYAIYSPLALLQHSADIGKTDKVPWIGKKLTEALKSSRGAPNAHATTEPFFSITRAQEELVKHSRDWTRWENEQQGVWRDRPRASAAVYCMTAAYQAIEKIEIDARPLAVQERKPENEGALVDLARRLDVATIDLFKALAEFVRHLHAEVPNYPTQWAGYEDESEWKIPIWPQWQLVKALQDERAKRGN